MAQVIDSANSAVVVELSQYAKDLEKRGIVAVGGIAVPKALGDAMLPAIEHSGMAATTWIRVALAKAVNFEAQTMGDEYVIDPAQFVPAPKAPKAKPLTQKQRLEAAVKEAEAAKAELEAAKAELAKLRVPTTPPTVQADPKTGKLVEKAA